MKRLLLLAVVILFSAGHTYSQIDQDFNNTTNIHSLSNKCWQFYGTSLESAPTSGDKYLSLSAPTINGNSWIRTPYIQLSTTSNISFTYQMAEPLRDGATRTITVSLLGLDGKLIQLKKHMLDGQAGTLPFRLTVTSTVNETQRLFIEVTAAGDEATPLYIDNLKIDGTFTYNAPYSCKDNDEGMTSIHYLKNFKGQMSANRLHLQWTVVENENNGYFDIERSVDGKNFQPVATLKATTRVAVEDYSHVESFSGNAYYRLKLVSKTGIKMYSNVLFFKTSSANQGLSLLQNPVQQTLKIGIQSERKTAATLSLYNLAGTKVFFRQFEAQKGYHTIAFTLDAQVQPGVYLVEVIYDQTRLTNKVLRQ